MPISNFTDPVYDAIKARITAAWTDCPIQWPNETWDRAPEEPWIKVEYEGNIYGQESIGAETQAANRWDRDGTLTLYLSVPRGDDIRHGYGAALQLANLFRGWRALDGNLEFGDALVAPNPFNSDVGAWFVIPVRIDWRNINA